MHTFAILDDCASVTLIEEEVAKKLKLDGPVTPLTMGWTKDIVSKEDNSKRVKFMISGQQEKGEKYQIRNARTVKGLSLPRQNIDVKKLRRHYPYLASTDLTNLRRAIPTVLIGVDHANLTAPLEVKLDPEEAGPIAIRTKLGWSLHGPERHYGDNDTVKANAFVICECQRSDEENLGHMMEKYFSIEDFGVQTPVREPESPADRRAREILENTTHRDGDRFSTGMLWKCDNLRWPDNYEMCLRRLISVEIKMRKNNEYRKSYCQKINEYVEKGYARKLDKTEVEKMKGNMWLLPHFGVSTINKPKMRFVFDAKAKYEGVSLNSQLMTGPDQYNSLMGVLFKFRQGEVAVAGDVMEMFHQVKIRKEDQNYQCFLWRDGQGDKEPDVYVMQVMIFGATCSPCSAQYVKNINAKQYELEEPRAVEGIVNRFYVDDYMDSFATPEEALEITSKVIDINKRGGFKLRNIISNSELVMNQLSKDKATKVLNLNVENEPDTERVLGMFWDIAKDEFLFQINTANSRAKEIKVGDNISKRELLRILMSVFDPLGLLAHYIVRAKIIMQDVWMRKIEDWGVPLPDDLSHRWLEWFQDLQKVDILRIPRIIQNRYLGQIGLNFIYSLMQVNEYMQQWLIGVLNSKEGYM